MPKGSRNADKTHCPRGHPFDADNTYVVRKIDGRTARQCIACRTARLKARVERLRAERGPPVPIIDRFESMYSPEPNTGCWLWMRACSKAGYGEFGVGPKVVRAHRWRYEYEFGPVPSGLHLDHLCRVRCCVNPQHLEPVTCRENVLRGAGPAAKQVKQTHCLNGHELTDDNTYSVPRTKRRSRQCKLCAKIRSRAAYARKLEVK